MIIDPYRYGTGGGGASATWNPADKGTDITLSNGNLTATGAVGWNGVRATKSASSGKRYYELVFDNNPGAGYQMIGIAKSTVGMNSYHGGDVNGWAWQPITNALKYNNNIGLAYTSCLSTDVVAVLADLTAGELRFYKNNADQGLAYSGLSGTFFPTLSLYIGAIMTTRFSTASWTYSPPSGYVEW